MIHSFDTHIAKICGVREAVLLYNIDFWIAKNRANDKHFYDGMYWTYNSTKAFAELFDYLTQRVIENLLAKLIKDGYLVKGYYNNSSFDRTSWYALTDKYYQLKQENPFHQTGKSISPNGEMEKPKWGNDIYVSDNKQDIKHTDKKHIYVQNEILHDCENQSRETKQSGEQLALFDNPQKPETPNPTKSKGYTKEFETFWAIYRKHNAKDKAFAFKSYCGALKEKTTHTQLLEALKKQIEIWEIKKPDPNFIPMCSTWLNKKRYRDDFEAIKRQALTRTTASAPKDYNSYEGGIESFKNLRDNDREADIDSIPKDIIKDMLRFIVHWGEIVKNGGYTNAEVEQLDRDGVKYIKDTYWSEVSLEDHLLSYGYGTNIYQLLKNKGYF